MRIVDHFNCVHFNVYETIQQSFNVKSKSRQIFSTYYIYVIRVTIKKKKSIYFHYGEEEITSYILCTFLVV